jgi:hypothetical protein
MKPGPPSITLSSRVMTITRQAGSSLLGSSCYRLTNVERDAASADVVGAPPTW